MFRPSFSVSIAFAAAAAFSAAAVAQEEPARQILKDVWAATSQQLLEVSLDTNTLSARYSGGSAFKAITFEPPVLGTISTAERGLVAVERTVIKRFENTTDSVDLTWTFDAAVELSVVTGVAATDDGTILVSGYHRRKRTYEIWELFPEGTPGGARFEPRSTGTPQLVDIVLVPPADGVDGSLTDGGGLLATAGKQVLFFTKNSNYATVHVLADAKSLGLKGATELTSADLIRETNELLVATTERKLLRAPVGGTGGPLFADLPLIPGRSCAALKPQRFVVRNVEPESSGSTVVSDACGQVVLYDYATTTGTHAATATLPYSAGFVSIAVAEGNEITCLPEFPCPLISRTDPTRPYDALTAIIESDSESQLIVLQYPVCDPRVLTASCSAQTGAVDSFGNLDLNALLPPVVQEALGAAAIKIPPYMFAAAYDGSFGVVFVQADAAAARSRATIELDVKQVNEGEFELGLDLGLPRLPSTSMSDPVRLLNQDILAYAPDNLSLPTVDGFEATPITTYGFNPAGAGIRGFSAIIYGLQHDVYPPTARDSLRGGGIVETAVVSPTATMPSCGLSYGGVTYTPSADPRKYFLNLIACLFVDEERLLNEVIEPRALALGNTTLVPSLQISLNQVKDKLVKALSGAGPNTGSETFGAVQSQLDNFDAAVTATPFPPSLEIYKNEILVRSEVFRFTVVERAIPSIPVGGF